MITSLDYFWTLLYLSSLFLKKRGWLQVDLLVLAGLNSQLGEWCWTCVFTECWTYIYIQCTKTHTHSFTPGVSIKEPSSTHTDLSYSHSVVYLSSLSVSVSVIHLMSHFWIKLASQSRSVPPIQLMDWMHDIWASDLCLTCSAHGFAERLQGRLC